MEKLFKIYAISTLLLSTMLATILIFILVRTGFSRSGPGDCNVPNAVIATAAVGGSTLGVPNIQRRVQDASDLWPLITNYGMFGNQEAEFDSTEGHEGHISCRYPGWDSMWDYLYMKALWVGAIAGGDTLVSSGHDGWMHEQEMFPGFADGDSILIRSNILSSPYYHPDARSNLDFYAVYTDTMLTGDYAGVSPNHLVPLDIRVTQRSFAWEETDYRDFILLEYRIENMGTKFLQDVFIGMYLDGDCGPAPTDNNSWYARAQDDVTGLHEFYHPDYDNISVAWMCDYERENGLFPVDDDTVAPHALAMVVVKTPAPELEINYNWWISDINAEKDFGPGTPFPDGGDGTPSGDINKYLLMSNRAGDPVDPDQLDTEWQGEPIGPKDSRFLLSFGSFEIDPGNSLTVALMMVAADFIDPDLNIQYADLEANVLAGLEWYEQTYSVEISGFRAREAAGSVRLEWCGSAIVKGCNLYRAQGGLENFERLNRNMIVESVYLDDAVSPGATYYYRITSIDASGRESDVQAMTGISLSGTPAAGAFALKQNYPNPFNPFTTVRYSLPGESPVEVSVYDTNGRCVRTLVNRRQKAGPHSVSWDGKDEHQRSLSSGIYLCRVTAGNCRETLKMVMVR